MTDHRPPTNSEFSDADQRRILELELIKIQSEASAARLEARAAEIELMLRRLAAEPSTETQDAADTSIPEAAPAAFARSESFSSWDELRSAPRFAPSPTIAVADPTPPVADRARANKTRIDGGTAGVPAPHFPATADESTPSPVGESDADDVVEEARAPAATALVIDHDARRPEAYRGEVAIDAQAAPEEGEEEAQRSRPAAWLVSAAAHLVVLIILAAIGLQTQRPKDQIALSASATEASEVSMETFSITSEEPEPEVTEPTPSETEYELSPVGEMAATDFAPDAPPAPPSPAAAALSSSALSSTAAMALKSDSSAKIQFCGVEGGGNHFVYLVDSSKSMREGFESARAELLASIDVLKPNQRFYVVFFDADPDYMRLSNPNENEPSSVYATPENKAALRRWAMRIGKNDGRAPYDPLEFALELKPDVIFLLSDGEFPQGIEDLLREQNKVENLFGDRNPISIVHTIGYHSKEGESRMRRIAEQNKGQYRYIPKP